MIGVLFSSFKVIMHAFENRMRLLVTLTVWLTEAGVLPVLLTVRVNM